MVGNNFEENRYVISKALRLNESFDLIERNFMLGEKQASMFMLDGFDKDEIMERILEFLMRVKKEDIADLTTSLFEMQMIPYVEVECLDDLNTVITQILSGTILLIVEDLNQAIAIDARTYPNRSLSEPEDDKVLRGSRDGFVETLVFNTALIRRRIRDNELTMKLMQVGNKPHTDVVLCYLNDRVDHNSLQTLQKEIQEIDIASLSLAQESLAECLIKKSWWNPFPRVRYTERPDTAAANIYEGKILVLVDNSPAAMILPTSFFDFVQETNDYYFPPLVGTYLRWVRGIVFFFTLFLTPLWYLFIQNPDLFPQSLHFLLVEEMNAVPILIQLLIVEFLIDAIKLACLNTPSSLNGSFGVIGALVLGEFAVKAHWFVPEVLLYMAFVSLANFTQPSYELGYSFKLCRILLLLMIGAFNVVGFIVGVLVIFMTLLFTKTILHQGYLYPLIPFHWEKLVQLMIRTPIDKKNT